MLAVGFGWASGLASSVPEAGNYTGSTDVAVDVAGNAYVLGGHELKSGAVDFDPSPGTTASTTARGAFVAKYAPDKTLLWVKELPSISSSGGIAVDASGVYVAGALAGDLAVDNSSLFSTYLLGIYNNANGYAHVQDGDRLTIANRANVSTVFEYDIDGVVDAGHVRIAYSATDSNVAVVLKTIDAINTSGIGVVANQNPGTDWGFTISYSNQVSLKDTFGNTPALGTPDGGVEDPRFWWSRQQDVFVAKLDATTGSVGWTYKSDWASFAGTLGLDDPYRRTFDLAVSSGVVYVAGSFIRQIDLNGTASGGILTAAKNSQGTDIQDGYVAQLNAANGAFVDARQIQLPNSTPVAIYGLAVDATTLYVAGEFNGGGLWKLKRNDLTDGTWGNNVPNPAVFTGGVEMSPRSVAVASNGDILVTGKYEGTVDFNPDLSTVLKMTSTKAAKNPWLPSGSGYSDDVFVVRMATNGGIKWAKSFGGSYNEQAFDIATDQAGNVYTTGFFIRSADFDPGRGTYTLKAQTTSSSDGFEAFVSKLDANGNFVWAGNMGGNSDYLNSDDEGHGIAVDGFGNIYTVGQFRGTGDFNPTAETFTLSTGTNLVLGGFLQKLTQSSPLMATTRGSGEGHSDPQSKLADPLSNDAQTVLHEAVRRWQMSGINVDSLHDIDIRVANLFGTTLGLAAGNTIWLDDDGAGWGWFVDRTPGSDREFSLRGDQGEQNRMDLLTVVMHELGHLLGHNHDSSGVMTETLSAGTRRAHHQDSHTASVDEVFHGAGTSHQVRRWSDWWFDQTESQRPWAKRRR